MKKNSKENFNYKHAGFQWTGWIKPANNAKSTRMHVIGANFDGSGFKEWDLTEMGIKVPCTCNHYSSEEEFLNASK